ncbi:hypothetical protein BLNAU_19825 [Blattamonas nauphoetae]|uniref:Ubiquitin-like domain-containing protein n=1 Tax=Blattamonas nauphoetae TaxID=2049346 RepID=A0ABQ9X1M4_9EUKA|nr:hypothetical protein BLNAU_19825 [Blattamonas nauphoetae]
MGCSSSVDVVPTESVVVSKKKRVIQDPSNPDATIEIDDDLSFAESPTIMKVISSIANNIDLPVQTTHDNAFLMRHLLCYMGIHPQNYESLFSIDISKPQPSQQTDPTYPATVPPIPQPDANDSIVGTVRISLKENPLRTLYIVPHTLQQESSFFVLIPSGLTFLGLYRLLSSILSIDFGSFCLYSSKDLKDPVPIHQLATLKSIHFCHFPPPVTVFVSDGETQSHVIVSEQEATLNSLLASITDPCPLFSKPGTAFSKGKRVLEDEPLSSQNIRFGDVILAELVADSNPSLATTIHEPHAVKPRPSSPTTSVLDASMNNRASVESTQPNDDLRNDSSSPPEPSFTPIYNPKSPHAQNEATKNPRNTRSRNIHVNIVKQGHLQFFYTLQRAQTILSIKEMLDDKYGIPVAKQVLECKGEILENSKVAGDYQLENEDTIVVHSVMPATTLHLFIVSTTGQCVPITIDGHASTAKLLQQIEEQTGWNTYAGRLEMGGMELGEVLMGVTDNSTLVFRASSEKSVADSNEVRLSVQTNVTKERDSKEKARLRRRKEDMRRVVLGRGNDALAVDFPSAPTFVFLREQLLKEVVNEKSNASPLFRQFVVDEKPITNESETITFTESQLFVTLSSQQRFITIVVQINSSQSLTFTVPQNTAFDQLTKEIQTLIGPSVPFTFYSPSLKTRVPTQAVFNRLLLTKQTKKDGKVDLNLVFAAGGDGTRPVHFVIPSALLPHSLRNTPLFSFISDPNAPHPPLTVSLTFAVDSSSTVAAVLTSLSSFFLASSSDGLRPSVLIDSKGSQLNPDSPFNFDIFSTFFVSPELLAVQELP